MPDDKGIIRLPAPSRRPPPDTQVRPDFGNGDAPANVVPLKKPQPRKMSLPAPAPTKAPDKPEPAKRLVFPFHRARKARVLPVKPTRWDNVVTLATSYWLDAFMRRVRLNLQPHQLMITHEKRLLLVDYYTA